MKYDQGHSLPTTNPLEHHWDTTVAHPTDNSVARVDTSSRTSATGTPSSRSSTNSLYGRISAPRSSRSNGYRHHDDESDTKHPSVPPRRETCSIPSTETSRRGAGRNTTLSGAYEDVLPDRLSNYPSPNDDEYGNNYEISGIKQVSSSNVSNFYHEGDSDEFDIVKFDAVPPPPQLLRAPAINGAQSQLMIRNHDTSDFSEPTSSPSRPSLSRGPTMEAVRVPGAFAMSGSCRNAQAILRPRLTTYLESSRRTVRSLEDATVDDIHSQSMNATVNSTNDINSNHNENGKFSITPNILPCIKCNRKWVIVTGLVLAAIGAIMGGIFAMIGSSKSNNNNNNTSSTLAPTAAPTISDAEAARWRNVILASSPSTNLESQTSPASMALQWMISDPIAAGLQDDQAMLQRFAVVNLWYSMNGTHWTTTDSWNSAPWLSPKGECTWSGILCQEFDGQLVVNNITLDSVDVSGFLPIEIALLSHLSTFSISTIGHLGGTLCTEIGRLSQLTSVIMSTQELSGSIPTELGALSKLRVLDLSGNNYLNGTIPMEMSQLIGLESLVLNQNAFTGGLPLSRLPTHLTKLDLSKNELHGSIATELGIFTNLRSLSLGKNNVQGGIPSELGLLSNLEVLVISLANLNGTIPTEIGRLLGLKQLILAGNDLTGSIPTELGLLKRLSGVDSLQLHSNQLNGTLPSSLCYANMAPRIDCGEVICHCCFGTDGYKCP